MSVLGSGAIPLTTIITLSVSVFVMILFPVAALLIFRHRLRFGWRAVLSGVLGFVVSQVLIRIPLISVLSTQSFYIAFAQQHTTLYILILALTAALFESAGRYVFIRLLCKDRYTFATGMGSGIAHGGIESIFLGVTGTLSVLVMAIVVNTGGEESLLSLVPQLAQTFDSLRQDSSWFYLLPGLERVMTICLHTGISMLFMMGFAKRQKRYYFFGFGLHALVDSCVMFPTLWVELILAAVAVFCIVMIIYLSKRFPVVRPAEGLPEGVDNAIIAEAENEETGRQ